MKKALSLVLALMMLFSLCITPVMAAEPDGSESNPYYVATPMAAPGVITIPANSTVYYQYKAAVFGGWEVGGYGLSAIIVDGVVFDTPDMWGEIYAPLNFTFVSPGVVGYVNDTDEDVEVSINHNEPMGTENNPDVLLDGENTFTIPTNVFPFYAVYLPMANGEYTFACAQTEDFDIYVDVDGTSHHLEEGSLTLALESYIPVVMTIAPMGVTPSVVIDITAPKAGTEDNPHWLEADVLYELNGTEPVYFQVDGSLSGNELLIESFNGTPLNILLDGTEYVAENGALYLPLETDNWVMDLVVSQDVDSENVIYFSIEYGEGSNENPIELADGDNAISIPENGYYYYSYTAESDGLLVLTPADPSVFGLLDIYCEDAEGNVYYGYLAEGASSALLPVPAGQTVIISACGVMDEETWINGAVDTVLNVAVKDLLLYNTFEGADSMGDLEGWTSSSDLVLEEAGEESNVANGFYSAEFNVTNDWGNIYRYVNVEANTDYEISFKAMAAVEGGLWVKFNDNWGPDVAQADLTIGTEWAEYSAVINSGNCTSLVLLLQYNGYAADGQVFWLDDIVITKSEGGDTPEPPVDGNLIVNGGFETGELSPWDNLYGWTSPSIVEDAHTGKYALKYSAAGAWQHVRQIIGVEANTDYVLTLWAKDANAMTFLIKNGADTANIKEGYSQAGSEWKQYTVEFNSGDNTAVIFTLMSNDANATAIIDDVVLAKADGDTPVVPPVAEDIIANGDFETGDATGWETWQGTTISGDAAHGGAYGAHLIGNGSWGGMLNQTVTVEAGKTYKLSFWINVNATGVNVQVKDGSGASIEGAGGWFDAKNVDKIVEWVFTATDDSVLINFCGSGASPEDVYVDDIVLAEMIVKEPSFDGYITNGDFETGDLSNWENLWNSCKYEFVEGYESDNAISIVAGNWSQIRQNGIAVKPNTDYVLTAWVKNSANFGLIVKTGDDTGDIANIIPETSDEWTQVTLQFNSGDQSEICVLLIGWEGGGSAIIDNVSLAEAAGPVVPDYIPGDVNNDGKINNKDLGVLKQYLADWEVELNLNACDVNGDGKINNKDMGLLQQFLNDWDVELKYGAMAE